MSLRLLSRLMSRDFKTNAYKFNLRLFIHIQVIKLKGTFVSAFSLKQHVNLFARIHLLIFDGECSTLAFRQGQLEARSDFQAELDQRKFCSRISE